MITEFVGTFLVLKKISKITKLTKTTNAPKTPSGKVPIVEKTVTITEIKAQINERHVLNSDKIAKSGKTADATMAPEEILSSDLKSFNDGKFTRIKGGDVKINGRTYGLKNDGKTLYPKSGGSTDFIDLTQGQIKAIQLIKNTPADKLKIAIEGAKISRSDYNFAKEFVKKY